MDFKNTKRKEIDNKLRELGENNRTHKSYLIKENLIQTKEWEEASSIYIYLDFKNEVKTRDIVNRAFEDKKRVYIPLIKGKELTFHQIESLEGLNINNFGIEEPEASYSIGIPSSDSILILPGIGFTITGKRLGRGGGFYDRYLNKNRKGIKVAIAFNEQIVTELETDPWDEKADIVVTDNKIYRG